jgi:hypothetical protein
MNEHLASWDDGPARVAIVDFVTRVTAEGGPGPRSAGRAGRRVRQRRDAVVRDSNALRWQEDGGAGGSIVYLAEPDVLDDGPVKPVRIWSRVGRRPIFAAGNSNGDIPTLRFAGGGGRPALRLVVDHHDGEREFHCTGGAEQALDAARSEGWTVVSVKDDWATVFADHLR